MTGRAALTVLGTVVATLMVCAPAAADLAYDDFESTAGLQVNGTAHRAPPVLRIANESGTGTVFTTQPVIGQHVSWSTRFVLRMHSGTNPPADGMAFVVQSDPNGAGALGAGGGGLGYATYEPLGFRGIVPAAVVEFDIWHNPPQEANDPNANHVAITTNGQHDATIADGTPGFQMYGAEAVYVWVDYDAVGKRLEVFVNDADFKPSTSLVGTDLDLGGILDGPARAGFTAARGDFAANFDVLSWHLDTPAQCGDGLDNDFDGSSDDADSGCESPADDVEALPGEGAPIAFVSNREGRTSRDAFRIEADGSGEERLTWPAVWAEWGEFNPDWSPDGRRVAFDTERDGGGAQVLWTIDADGTDAARVVGMEDAVVPGIDPSWDPTGGHLAFTHFAGGDYELYRIPAAGGTRVTLTENTAEDRDPAWSPDGKLIAFASNREGTYDIWVMPAGGGGATRLTSGPGDERRPAWSNDGSLIAYTSATTELLDRVAVMNADGSGQRVLTEGREPSFSPDCDELTYVAETLGSGGGGELALLGELSSQDDIHVIALEDGEPRRVTRSSRDDAAPDWRPTGETIPCGDAPTAPEVSVSDVEVAERDEVASAATFEVTLARPAGLDGVAVDYKTSDFTATAADYVPASGTLVFAPGRRAASVTVDVLGDRLDEVEESFQLDLSDPGGGELAGDTQASADIADDDAPPPVLVRDAWAAEGDAGTTGAGFVVELAKASGKPVVVEYATRDETAQAGSDYDARAGSVTIPPGSRTATVAVPVRGDTAREYDFERFRLDVVGSTNPLDNTRAIGTIVDDEPGPGVPVTYPDDGARSGEGIAVRHVDRGAPPKGKPAAKRAKAKKAKRACPRSKRTKARRSCRAARARTTSTRRKR